jgi:hypothetical protein
MEHIGNNANGGQKWRSSKKAKNKVAEHGIARVKIASNITEHYVTEDEGGKKVGRLRRSPTNINASAVARGPAAKKRSLMASPSRPGLKKSLTAPPQPVVGGAGTAAEVQIDQYPYDVCVCVYTYAFVLSSACVHMYIYVRACELGCVCACVCVFGSAHCGCMNARVYVCT